MFYILFWSKIVEIFFFGGTAVKMKFYKKGTITVGLDFDNVIFLTQGIAWKFKKNRKLKIDN